MKDERKDVFGLASYGLSVETMELLVIELPVVSGGGYVCKCTRSNGTTYEPYITQGFLWTGSASECKGYCCDNGGAKSWVHFGFAGQQTSGSC